jgi:hypothetical protein
VPLLKVLAQNLSSGMKILNSPYSFDSSTSDHEHDPFLNVLSRSSVLLYVRSHGMGFVADL